MISCVHDIKNGEIMGLEKSYNQCLPMNNLKKIDYPCDLKLWHMYFCHHLSIYANFFSIKGECHFKSQVTSMYDRIFVIFLSAVALISELLDRHAKHIYVTDVHNIRVQDVKDMFQHKVPFK